MYDYLDDKRIFKLPVWVNTIYKDTLFLRNSYTYDLDTYSLTQV